MTLQVPDEVAEGLMILILTGIWKSYRSLWRHVNRVEKRVLTVMVMLRDRGFVVPDESDTQKFIKSNNL